MCCSGTCSFALSLSPLGRLSLSTLIPHRCPRRSPAFDPTSPPAAPAGPSAPQPSCAPAPWRRTTFFPTGSHIVPASPHARGPGTLQQAGGTSKAGRPTAAACRSSSQLQFVIIIKGLTPEASLPLFAPLTLPPITLHGAPLKATPVTHQSPGVKGMEERRHCWVPAAMVEVWPRTLVDCVAPVKHPNQVMLVIPTSCRKFQKSGANKRDKYDFVRNESCS